MNITQPVRRHARLIPAAVAVTRIDGVNVPYRDLDRTIDSIAQRALDLGLVAGDTVLLDVNDGYAFLALSLGLARIGAAATPTFMPGERIALCLRDQPGTNPAPVRSVNVDPSWWQAPASNANVRAVPMHDEGGTICRYFHTSGTTGTPKFIATSHDLLTRRIYSKWLGNRMPDAARAICFIGPGTHYGFFTMLRVLWTGGQVVMPTSAELLVPLIQRHRVNVLVVPPIILQLVATALPRTFGPLPSLDVIEVGGSALPNKLFDLARLRLGPNIVVSFGSIETAGVASAPKSAVYNLAGAAGFVHPDVEVQVVDDNDLPLPHGTEGILRIRGPNCVDRYVGDPALSADVFRNGWVYLGDLARTAADGLLTLSGRVSEMINNGGNKVSPLLIEEALMSLPNVRDVAAFGVPDEMGIAQIWAAIVPAGQLDLPALQVACRERLGGRAPTHILQLDEIPRNPNGKVLREALRQMALGEKPGVPAQPR